MRETAVGDMSYEPVAIRARMPYTSPGGRRKVAPTSSTRRLVMAAKTTIKPKVTRSTKSTAKPVAAAKPAAPASNGTWTDIATAELKANPKLKIPATGASIVKAKRPVEEGGLGLRWERVAVYAGISVAEAKKLWMAHTGNEDTKSAFTGRGRNFNGTTPKPKAKGGRASAKPAASTTKATTKRTVTRSGSRRAEGNA